MSEIDLIHKCQAWEIERFGELYNLYIDKIYRYIYLKTSDKQIAEDLTSNVFLKALEKIPDFEFAENSSFQSWLYTIAHNKVVDHYRWEKKDVSIDEIFSHHFYKSDDYAKLLDNKDKLQQVKDFLNWLKSEHAQIVLLRIWEDLSYEEISEITWKTPDNCKQIFSRSLKKIQANIVSLLLIILFI